MTLPDKVKKLPNWSSKSHGNRWADFIELSCLNHPDRYFSIEDMMKHYSDEKPEEMDRGDGQHSAKYDTFFADIEGIYELISFRATTLGDFYPFEMDGNHAIFLRESLSTHHEFYFFLLLSSNLRLFDGSTMQALTHAFEDISRDVLQEISSPRAKTHVFGTARNGTELHYRGNKRERIKTLANHLYALASPILDSDSKYDASGGDDGLDLVSFIQIDDMPFIPVSFGQCACSHEEWTRKQFEISPDLWGKKMFNLSPYLQFMFVPFYYRRASGEFENASEILTCLIDRHRFFKLATPALYQRFAEHLIYQVVQDIICIQNAASRSEV